MSSPSSDSSNRPHDGDVDVDPEPEPESQTQTQEASQNQAPEHGKQFDEHLWAFLSPITQGVTQVDFLKPITVYRIGRDKGTGLFFPSKKISFQHAEITWDGRESADSTITVKDFSSNGTFVNGVKLGKGFSRVLTDGAEIAFGSRYSSDPSDDYRYIFRHTASGKPPTEGFYAEYDICHELGRGSFASVYKCMDRKGRFWAAKELNKTLLFQNDGNSLSSRNEIMVAREVAILRKISHPNICSLKNLFFQDGGKLILVLELIEGGDLLRYILSNGSVDEATTQHITYQLCLALSYIHLLGITHRDLKPENILLTKGDPPNVKVADFGLAKYVDSQTMLKTMCGTPDYLAPEVCQQIDEEGYDNLVDSWSVGVIVFSMLTNKTPFIQDQNQPDIRVRVATRCVDWSRLTGKFSDKILIDFIDALLRSNPVERMTLTGALDHPWLTAYAHRTGRDAVADRNLGCFEQVIEAETSKDSTTAADDGRSKRRSGIFAGGFENLTISDENIAGPSNHADLSSGADDEDSQERGITPPPSSQAREVRAQDSGILRRRRDILDEVEEGVADLSHPSPELLSQFDERHKRAATAVQSRQPARKADKGHGKRTYDDLLSAVPEPSENDGAAGGDDIVMNEPKPAKRRRQSEIVTPRSRKGQKNIDSSKLRRSTRNAGMRK